MEIKHGRETSRQSRTTGLAINFDEEQPRNPKIPIRNCSSSSSSSDCSPDLELLELDTPNNSQPVFVSQGPVTSLPRVPSKTSVACKRSGLFQPPPVQVMDPAGNYDPNRIPSAVFASRPMTPVEWSLASNESLFSIRTGNSSFNMRHFSQASICKSPELTKFEGLFMNFPLSQYPLTGTGYSARESVCMDRRSDVVESSSPDTPKVVLNGARNKHVNNENQQSEYAFVEEGKYGVIEEKILTSEDAAVEEGKADVIEGQMFAFEDAISAALPDSDLSFSIPDSAFQGQRDREETESGKMEEVKAKPEVHKNGVEAAAPYDTGKANTQCVWFFSCCRLCD